MCLCIVTLSFRFAEAIEPLQNLDPRPNVVVFLSDDQGWGDFSFTGNQDLSTPNIDSLARDGAVFQNFFVCPVCSPTRAEFLTGRYFARTNIYSTSAGGERMDLDEVTIAQHFQSAGYATAALGKWHNGTQYPYHPNARGFNEFYGFCSGHWGHYFDTLLEHNGQMTEGKGFCVDDFTNHAMELIKSNQDKPFFVYLPYNTPHSPMQVPDRFWKKFADKELTQPSSKPEKEQLDHTRCALAMCENIDWNVGRVLKQLDELKLSENTIVIYFNDNGPNGWRWNGGMKGKKGSTDEGGVKTPMIVRWPAATPAGTRINAVAGAIDVLPTLCKLCEVPIQGSQKLDGVSFALELKGAKVKRRPRTYFNAWRNRISARTGAFRLDDKGNLFNMISDPAQTKAVNKENPEVAERLLKQVDTFRADVMSQIDADGLIEFPIGHPDCRFTQLPARDAIATGKIKRSNRYPNCSFFTAWTRSEDTISWPVEVLKSGRYQVDLYYTCGEENTGVEMELEFAEARLPFKITEAHDPPLVGAADDRFKRAESYVKKFKPANIGIIELDAGKGKLVLRTRKLAGKQSIDFRLLFLTRVEE